MTATYDDWNEAARTFRFARVHLELIPAVGIDALLLLDRIAYLSHANEQFSDGWFHQTIAEWEESTSLSKYQQQQARKRLVALGLIDTEQRGSSTTLWFRANFDAMMALLDRVRSAKNSPTPATNSPTQCEKLADHHGEKLADHGEKLADPIPIIETVRDGSETSLATSPAQVADDAADAGFDAFWSVWPKRRARGDAERAYAKAAAAVGHATIMAGLLAQLPSLAAEMQRENGKYVPFPATWLNQRRWEDDVSPVVPKRHRLDGTDWSHVPSEEW